MINSVEIFLQGVQKTEEDLYRKFGLSVLVDKNSPSSLESAVKIGMKVEQEGINTQLKSANDFFKDSMKHLDQGPVMRIVSDVELDIALGYAKWALHHVQNMYDLQETKKRLSKMIQS